MKLLRLNRAAIAFFFLSGVFAGCAHKKPVLVMPQQPPPIAPQPTPTPEPAGSQPAEQPQEEQQPAATPADQPKTSTAKTKAKRGEHAATPRKPVSPAPANGDKSGSEVARNTPPKKVIPADRTELPPPAGGQISLGPTRADATDGQTSTEQLLQSTEQNLNGIKRQLSKEEEAIRTQIKEFINQSHKATTENDPARAHNFALKARLLSDELVKQR
jgi:hypothetical protein